MGIRAYPSKKFMFRNFIDMRDLDEDIQKAQSKEDVLALIERLDHLIRMNESRWLSETEVRFYFVKKNLLLGMQKQLNDLLKSYES